MSIGQIIEGNVNNLLNKKEELYRKRMKICDECPLLKTDGAFGKVCNSRLYLNPETNETVKTRTPGFFRGCGCLLHAKTRVESAKCPAGKW